MSSAKREIEKQLRLNQRAGYRWVAQPSDELMIATREMTATKLCWDLSWHPKQNAVYEMNPTLWGERYLLIVSERNASSMVGTTIYGCSHSGEEARVLQEFTARFTHREVMRTYGYTIKEVEDKMELKDMVAEFEAIQKQLEIKRARRAPAANRLTLISRAPQDYRWYRAGEDKRRRDVKFCVSFYVNVAGYVLTWRQVEYWTSGPKPRFMRKRHDWAAFLTSEAAHRCAKRRRDKWREKNPQRGKHPFPEGDNL